MVEKLIIGAILGYFLPLPTFLILGLLLYLKTRDNFKDVKSAKQYFSQKFSKVDASSTSKLLFSLVSMIKSASQPEDEVPDFESGERK